MSTPPRPFTGRKLTRRERRAADKRAQARADALAKAMPPPASGERVDPLSGRPLHTGTDTGWATGLPTPTPTAAQPAPQDTPAPAAAPAPAPTPRSASAPAPAGRRLRRTDSSASAPVPAGGSSEGSSEGGRRLRGGRRRATDAAAAGLVEQRPPLLLRMLAPVDPTQAGVNLLAGLVLVVLGVAVAGAYGLPVLGHGWQGEPLAGGGLLLAAGAGLSVRGWPTAGNRLRVPAAALAALLVTSFTVGLAGDPVVVDGRVLLNTSSEAQSARLLTATYADLRRMGELDELLVADIAAARARVSEFDPAVAELTTLAEKYAVVDAGDLPDPAFEPLMAAMKTTAYWANEAMRSKRALVAQDDSRTAENLATQRASFTEAWVSASTGLQDVAFALNIPVADHLKGPHE